MRGARTAAIAVGALLALAAGTYVAGEQNEVAVLRTVEEAGTAHETKLWVVDLDGTPWVRVARPSRRWFERLEAHPDVELIRSGVTSPHRAVAISDPAMRARVAAAFREKYGWVDRWYGLVLRRDSTPVRLDPVAGPREAMRP